MSEAISNGFGFPIHGRKYENGKLYLAQGDLGAGLFAARRILTGELVLVFAGPLIGFKDAIALGDRECWPLQIGQDRYINLDPPGCFANHSCNPNSGIVDNGGGEVRLVATRQIESGEEIRYDYSTTMDEDSFTMPCRCGSRNCRQVVTDFKKLPAHVQRRYIEVGLVMRFIHTQHSIHRRGVTKTA